MKASFAKFTTKLNSINASLKQKILKYKLIINLNLDEKHFFYKQFIIVKKQKLANVYIINNFFPIAKTKIKNSNSLFLVSL